MGRSEGWSKQGSTSKKCVPTTREVLIDHLRAKSRCVVAQVEEEDVAQLVRDASNEDMLRLLCDSDLLRHRLEGIVLERSKK